MDTFTNTEMIWVRNWEDLHGYGSHTISYEDGDYHCLDCSVILLTDSDKEAHLSETFKLMDEEAFLLRDQEFKEDFGWSPYFGNGNNHERTTTEG